MSQLKNCYFVIEFDILQNSNVCDFKQDSHIYCFPNFVYRMNFISC